MDDRPQPNPPDAQPPGNRTLDYASPHGPASDGPRPPNPIAQRSFWCGTSLLMIVLLATTLPVVGDIIGLVLGILICLSWPTLSVLAIVFGIIGYRRAKHLGLDGAIDAGIGLTAGILGIALTLFMILAAIEIGRQCAPDGRPNRIKCQFTLHRIGSACHAYAKEHGGQYPLRLDQLYTADHLEPRDFICPTTEDTPASGNTPAEVVAALAQPGHCSYVYLGAGLTPAAPPNTVLAYEKFTNHEKRGMHILYANRQIVWLDAKAAEKFITNLKTQTTLPTSQPTKKEDEEQRPGVIGSNARVEPPVGMALSAK
ncbi:MAG TPA: DUF4190 domain-containing protein [Tepidisphaeraceae bacterium]|nr:DUF4190 domain-containing protein [Tepidisphaeraceae bacterium]